MTREEITDVFVDPLCPICYEKIQDICTTDCGHIFCKNCIEGWFNNNKETCPLCRGLIDSYRENDMKVKIIKLTGTVSDEETLQYTMFLRSLIGRIRFFKYSNYCLSVALFYTYWSYRSLMNEYIELNELCNGTLSNDRL
jgi:hypothetical protein